jgi:mRNA interferase RelE/StbE
LASNVEYKASVAGDLKRIDKPVARRIVGKLESVLRADPGAGVPLSGEFRGLYKLRVGDFRVIYAKTSTSFLVLRIAHRKEVYRSSLPR